MTRPVSGFSFQEFLLLRTVMHNQALNACGPAASSKPAGATRSRPTTFPGHREGKGLEHWREGGARNLLSHFTPNKYSWSRYVFTNTHCARNWGFNNQTAVASALMAPAVEGSRQTNTLLNIYGLRRVPQSDFSLQLSALWTLAPVLHPSDSGGGLGPP